MSFLVILKQTDCYIVISCSDIGSEPSCATFTWWKSQKFIHYGVLGANKLLRYRGQNVIRDHKKTLIGCFPFLNRDR